MQPKVLKYILDILSVISEIESIKKTAGNDFQQFKTNFILQRAVERDLEIIGEAVKKIIELAPDTPITAARNIIGLRNLISHAYDSIDPEMIWAIIQKDIPLLEAEMRNLRE